MTALHKNHVQMTVTGAPGTGAITLAAAASGMQSFATAYGANATVDLLFTDAAGVWGVERNCSYVHAGSTITRGTAEDGSSGAGVAVSLTSAAVVSVILSAAKGNSIETLMGAFGLDEIAVTGAVTATIGRMHHCTGTSADYTVTLPAASGNTGKLIGFRMGSAAGLTKLVTIDGNASEEIDGATTRIMWATETAILLCDGSNWHKVAGKSVPMSCSIYRDTAQSIANTTFTKVNCVSTYYDPASLADTATNHKITIGRTGLYAIEGALRVEETSSVTGYVLVYKNAAEILRNSVLSAYPNPQLSNVAQLTKNDYLQLYVYHNSGASRDVSFNVTIPCVMTISEIVKW